MGAFFLAVTPKNAYLSIKISPFSSAISGLHQMWNDVLDFSLRSQKLITFFNTTDLQRCLSILIIFYCQKSFENLRYIKFLYLFLILFYSFFFFCYELKRISWHQSFD